MWFSIVEGRTKGKHLVNVTIVLDTQHRNVPTEKWIYASLVLKSSTTLIDSHGPSYSCYVQKTEYPVDDYNIPKGVGELGDPLPNSE